MAFIQIQWTSANLAEAKEVCKALVLKRWVACANILPYVDSFYLQEGKLKEDKAVKVFFKTSDAYFNRVRDYIIQHASYDVSEITKINIADANPEYIAWLFEQLND